MSKFAGIAAITMGLLIAQNWQEREENRTSCVQECYARWPPDAETQRQELVTLEKEAVHAIQLKNGTFFRHVYGDDFVGTLSHGQQVNRGEWVALVQSADVKYESFNTSDIKVQIYQDTAVATCLWSARSIFKGQRISRQMRVIHVYINTPNGWHVVSAQTTSLPPDVEGML